ncbi:MAG: response regulator [Chloroflexi bacterium]|nr:response regulator [Chloroflexota bacterium]
MEAATTQKPELILLDVMMPVMDGFQVLKKLKANDDTKEIPVIMLTAKSQERDVVTGLESGAEDYVIKPFSFPELLARINGALEKKR